MTITVAIMSYGYAHLASHAVESVLAQTRKADEVIIVDDGKHDGIEAVAQRYGIQAIVRENNLGIIDNFNEVQKRAQTDYLLMLGADNWLHRDCLADMHDVVVNDQADIVSTDIEIWGTEAQDFAQQVNAQDYVWKFTQGDIEQGNYIHGSSLYRVALAKEVGGYERNPASVKTEEDWMLWRKMLRAGAKHTHIKRPHLIYRRHKANFQ